jgi:formylglycine-generating enzyme required for sulfatase activity
MMDRIPEATPQKRRRDAERLVERFTDNFSMGHRELAKYAAVPLVLTPELVNHLRSRFLRRVPWIAEADLLLSELCSAVGYEQYVMDADVRACLVDELEEKEPLAIESVARDLIRYIQYLQKTNRYLTERERRRQQWSAMGFVGEMRSQLAEDLVLEFDRAIMAGGVDGAGLVSRSDLAFLVAVTRDSAARLGEHQNLLKMCERVSNVLKDVRSVDQGWLAREVGGRSAVEVPNAPSNPVDLASDLQEFAFEYGVFEEGNVEGLQTFEFDILTLEKDTLTPAKRRSQIQGYVESLGNDVAIEMMQIPGGTFIMGAPKGEASSRDCERPTHSVTVPSFSMGRYPVTQAQWRFVAGLPKVDREIELDPSKFKGGDRPVERVSWLDAIEFCTRLSKYTGQEYRLPTEAEWEYACRAGTRTPFHFGETILSDVANYDGNYTYGSGVKGLYRGETVPAGSFQAANHFDLYDMHGNVWEWCMDYWHQNYKEAPDDGSAWIDTKLQNTPRMLRGGSWRSSPRLCRSASRISANSAHRNLKVGFRLSCPARINSKPPRLEGYWED